MFLSSQSTRLLGLQKQLRRIAKPDSDSTILPTLAQPASLLQGVVTATATGPPLTVSIQLGGSTTTISGIRYNKTLTPTVGMTVWVVRSGNDMFVLCTLA